jgi:tetratricopeptide (TPR) repeat protein
MPVRFSRLFKLCLALAGAATLALAGPAFAQGDPMERGVDAYNAGRFAEAADAYKAETERDPGNYLAWAYLGDAYVRSDRAALAEAAYRRSIQLEPDCLPCQQSYGSFLYNAGRYEEALPRYELVARGAPEDPNVLAYLGDAYRQLGRVDEAEDQYRQSLSIDPRQRFALRGMVFLAVTAGDGPATQKAMQALRRHYPDDADQFEPYLTD